MQLKVKQLTPSLVVPAYQTKGAAGFDLCAASSGMLVPAETRVIGTGIAMEIPEGFVGFVCSRSGLAAKHGVFVLNAPGVIDSDYRGEVGVILHNAGTEIWTFKAGDRIAQLVPMPVSRAWIRFVSELSGTERGAGGFGSTDKKGGEV